MAESLNILAIGDIMGRPGRNILKSRLQGLKDIHRVDFVIANGENVSGGRSITPQNFAELSALGIHVFTSGNHIWDNKEVYTIIDREPGLLRPANYPEGVAGKGFCIKTMKGVRICVINLLGRLFLQSVDCPFRAFDRIYEQVKELSDIIVVDFHAEATSEKRAFGWYVDGRASFVFGTHTHVQTADEEILERGTGYITDAGMTGAFDSVIGMNKHMAIDRFLRQINEKKEMAVNNPKINAVLAKIGIDGRTSEITRIVV
jgi:hypothetical protein